MDEHGVPANGPRQRLVPQGAGHDDRPRPTWMIEAHDDLAIRRSVPSPPGRSRWRAVGVVMAAVLILGVGFAGGLWVTGGDGGELDADGEPGATATVSGAADSGDGDDAAAAGLDFPDADDLPQGEDADRLSIRIETPTDDGDEAAGDGATGVGGATATVREDGLVYFEGAFRSQDEADSYIRRAAEVFGEEAVVERYTIDPDAPVPTAGDVALDKPVLFESGSAVIHPDYIPFLEACGDVLRLNPTITMSISAFTDSVGDEEFNLDLSRRRAEAIIAFYRELDIDDDQLVGTGFGETQAIADNTTEEGRSANRRAMLQLLNVMSADPADGEDQEDPEQDEP